jgi:hypothetical protein
LLEALDAVGISSSAHISRGTSSPLKQKFGPCGISFFWPT